MSNMLDILKKFDAVEQKTRLNECGEMPPSTAPSTPVTVNLTAPTASDMAQILRALTNIESGAKPAAPMPATPMAMAADAMEAEYEEVDINEEMDPQSIMGQIRKMAKGVEQSPDERAHRAFAQEVESDLIDLFQHFQQNMDTKNAEAIRGLIKQNKAAQQTTDPRNANNIAEVLYGLMRGTAEAFVNEPDEKYADHKFMTKDLSGGINRQKNMYPPAAKGDNPMAVEASGLSPVYIQHLTKMFGDRETLSKREIAKAKDIIGRLTINDIKTLAKANIPHLSQMAAYYIKHNTPGGMVRQMENTSIKDRLWAALNEKKDAKAKKDYDGDGKVEKSSDEWKGSRDKAIKKAMGKKTNEAAKPDFLDMDKDGNKKEPMKKAVADKKKNPFGNKK